MSRFIAKFLVRTAGLVCSTFKAMQNVSSETFYLVQKTPTPVCIVTYVCSNQTDACSILRGLGIVSFYTFEVKHCLYLGYVSRDRFLDYLNIEVRIS